MWSAAAPRSPSRHSGIPSTSTRPGSNPTASTTTASPSVSSPRLRRARGPSLRRARCPIGSGSPSRRARTGSRATTPPTATWWSRATSMPSCSSATTSTSTRAAAMPTPAAARPGRTSSARRSSSTASGTRCTTATRCCRRAHALVPWIITWDDHEVDNDYAGDVSEQDDDVEAFRTRRAAAYQAWYEHMPVRLDPPDGPDYAIYRSFAHGDLLRFHVLDTRQYRSDQQRGEPFVGAAGRRRAGAQTRRWRTIPTTRCSAPSSDRGSSRTSRRRPRCGTCSRSRCSCSAATPSPAPNRPWWWSTPGTATQANARWCSTTLGATADNLIVLTGDFHSAAVAELRADPFDPSLPVVGTEFMASSISSSFFDDDETVERSRHRCPDRQSPPEVVRRPARLHGVRGHPRPLARHLSRRGRPVRRGITGHDHRFVGGARRCPRRARGVVTAQRRWRPQCGHGRAPRST